MAPLGPPSALTPKPGRPRDPAKKLAGWNLPEAEETREMVTALGRSGRPILIGPWLSEAGFELLYWIPFLAWAKAYGNLDPSQLVVISRGGAASWYRDITTNYEDVLSFYSPEEFRARNDAAHRRTARPAEARRDLELRPRDHREGHRETRPQRRPPAAPVDDVPAVRPFLVPAGAGDAHRGVHVVRAAAAG